MYKEVEIVGELNLSGFLHEPKSPNGAAVVLTHGAGANCHSRLLIDLADALTTAWFTVLRFDLPFRQARPHGPPRPGSDPRDRAGLRQAANFLKNGSLKRVFLAGHSYGGRQASMLLAEDPDAADGLLSLSYPLHPPRKPAELRIRHLPILTKPALFVHGTRDPFGTIGEMKTALGLIPGPHRLMEVEGAGHDLVKKSAVDLPANIVREFESFLHE